jgi:hypothetical protein
MMQNDGDKQLVPVVATYAKFQNPLGLDTRNRG